MKKLLLLLFLLPLLSFGQDFNLKHEILEEGPFSPGDTITVKYTLTDLVGDVNVKLLQFDTGYDDTRLVRVGTPNWIVSTPDNKTFTQNYWTGYTYNPDSTYDPLNLRSGRAQFWLGGGVTAPSRYTIQSTDDIEGQLFLQQFKILEATDYTEALGFKWAIITDNLNASTYTIKPDPGLYVDFNVTGTVPAGTINFHVELPDLTHAEDYRISIEPLSQWQDMQDGVTVENYEYVQGNFDINGNFTTYDLKQDVVYVVHAFVENQWDEQNQTPIYPAWLDDVVTVSDIILTFKEAIGTNIDGTGTTFNNVVQRRLGNVLQEGPNDPLDFNDSYAMLAHLVGILDNSAGTNGPPAEGQKFYPITSFNNGAFNMSSLLENYNQAPTSQEEWLAQNTFTITSADPTNFTIAHALIGDVDLSHSTIPPLQANLSAKSFSISKSASQTRRVIDTDVDVTSELKNGLVELNIDVNKNDLVGMQMNLSYDKSILTFKEVVFDTGNAMTNFAKPLDGKIIVGTIDPQIKEAMKSGRPFKVVFETKQTINNTAGLISFDVTDAVTKDGTKVKLNIK